MTVRSVEKHTIAGSQRGRVDGLEALAAVLCHPGLLLAAVACCLSRVWVTVLGVVAVK